jgi:hypothetical protein
MNIWDSKVGKLVIGTSFSSSHDLSLSSTDIAQPEICIRKKNHDTLVGHRDVQDTGTILTTLVTKTDDRERSPGPEGYTWQLADFLRQTSIETASNLKQVCP